MVNSLSSTESSWKSFPPADFTKEEEEAEVCGGAFGVATVEIAPTESTAAVPDAAFTGF